MFNRRAERFLKIDGVLDMETVHGMAPCPVPIPLLGIADKRIVEFFLEHPRVVEVIFHSGSVNGCAGGFSINKKHVVALTPPSSREPEHVQDCSHKLALTLRLHEHVVVLAIHILAT